MRVKTKLRLHGIVFLFLAVLAIASLFVNFSSINQSADLALQNQMKQSLVSTFLFIILGIEVAVISSSVLLGKSIISPLHILESASKSLQKGSHVEIEMNRNDEFQGLATSLNKTSKELKKISSDQKDLDRAKKDFLLIASHELKTPLTVIKSQSELLNKGYVGKISQEQKKSLNMILKKTDYIEGIIHDIMDSARIESSQMKLDYLNVNMPEHLKKLAAEMDEYLPEKKIALKLHIKNIHTIQTDASQLDKVLRNLISNAKKFSPKGSKVDITAESNGEKAIFSVKDRGSGIPLKYRAKIFEPFFQAEKAASRTHGGTGLGLSICKSLVELMGGKIWLEKSSKKGSVFCFEIPAKVINES